MLMGGETGTREVPLTESTSVWDPHCNCDGLMTDPFRSSVMIFLPSSTSCEPKAKAQRMPYLIGTSFFFDVFY
jgi:hypothetical protein